MSQPRSGACALSLIAPSALSVNSSTDQGGGKRRACFASDRGLLAQERNKAATAAALLLRS